MEKELKDAIVTIAEYNDPLAIIIYVESDDELYDTQATWPFRLLFHTSADALLPVWRKVGERIEGSYELTRIDTFYTEFGCESHHENTGKLILNDDYPAACIKLAEIIKQLKNG